MPRKGPVAKRDVLPDPIYNSKLVTRLINRLMVDGNVVKLQQSYITHLISLKKKLETIQWKFSNKQ